MARRIPVRHPAVNKNIRPRVRCIAGDDLISVANHLNTFTPIGTAIMTVADVKYARVSTSMPTVSMWWVQTIKSRNPMDVVAHSAPICLKVSFSPRVICDNV